MAKSVVLTIQMPEKLRAAIAEEADVRFQSVADWLRQVALEKIEAGREKRNGTARA